MKTYKERSEFLSLIGILAVATLAGCGTAKVTSAANYTPQAKARPQMLYVANFDLQAARIEKEPGLLPILKRAKI